MTRPSWSLDEAEGRKQWPKRQKAQNSESKRNILFVLEEGKLNANRIMKGRTDKNEIQSITISVNEGDDDRTCSAISPLHQSNNNDNSN